MSDFFISNCSMQEIAKEKAKARELRKKQWWLTLAANGICYYCGKKFDKSEITMDHIVPIVRGGKSTKGNIVASCKECNSKKKYMLPIEMLQSNIDCDQTTIEDKKHTITEG